MDANNDGMLSREELFNFYGKMLFGDETLLVDNENISLDEK
jgi:hypothetical protein